MMDFFLLKQIDSNKNHLINKSVAPYSEQGRRERREQTIYPSGLVYRFHILIFFYIFNVPKIQRLVRSVDGTISGLLMPLIKIVGSNSGVIAFFEITICGHLLSRLMSRSTRKRNGGGFMNLIPARGQAWETNGLRQHQTCRVYALLGPHCEETLYGIVDEGKPCDQVVVNRSGVV